MPQSAGAADSLSTDRNTNARPGVLIIEDPYATEAFSPLPANVQEMVRRGITELTRPTTTPGTPPPARTYPP